MQTAGHENAMTEIALALAMGFFSIMVLTLISFGAPVGETATVKAVAVAPSQSPAGGVSTVGRDDLIVVYHDGRFLDGTMKPLTPDAIAAHKGRVILAISPAATLQDVLTARTRIRTEDLVVTELDAAWLDALNKRGGARP